VTSVITEPCIDVKDRAYVEEEILRAYTPTMVGLLHRYPICSRESCSYKPGETVEEVRRNFNIKALGRRGRARGPAAAG
jgi:hypothetical protein